MIVLKELNNSDLSGYALMEKIKSSYGKKPSSGSIYPLLKDLQEKKYIKFKEEGVKKIYSLTAKGKKLVIETIKEKEELMIKHINLFNLLSNLDEKSAHQCIDLVNDFKNKDCLLLFNIEERIKLDKLFLKLSILPNYSDKEKEIKSILNDATKKIDKIYKALSKNKK